MGVTHIFIPVTSLLLESFKLAKNYPNSSEYKICISIANKIKVSRILFNNRSFQEFVVLLVLGRISAHFSYQMAFKELSFTYIKKIQKYSKIIKIKRLKIQIRDSCKLLNNQ